MNKTPLLDRLWERSNWYRCKTCGFNERRSAEFDGTHEGCPTQARPDKEAAEAAVTIEQYQEKAEDHIEDMADLKKEYTDLDGRLRDAYAVNTRQQFLLNRCRVLLNRIPFKGRVRRKAIQQIDAAQIDPAHLAIIQKAMARVKFCIQYDHESAGLYDELVERYGDI